MGDGIAQIIISRNLKNGGGKEFYLDKLGQKDYAKPHWSMFCAINS